MTYQEVSNSVTIKLLGFNDDEKASFSSILTLAERNLKKNWLLINETPANFYMIKESLIPQMDQLDMLKNIPRGQCIFIRRNNVVVDVGGHHFYWGEGQLPSLRSLAEFLNQLELTPSPPAQPDLRVSVSTLESSFFDPEQGLLGQLLTHTKNPRLFKFPNQDPPLVLYIDNINASYYSNVNLEQMKPYLFATDGLQVTNFSYEEFESAVTKQTLKARPLNHLLWFMAFTCSQGKIIKGHKSDDIVQLKHWPDINLPGCKKLIKLAAYMHSNAVDLATVQANTGIPLAQINDFYNACKIIGLIVHNKTTEIHEKHLDINQKELFAKIGKRLGQAMQVETLK